VRRRHGRYAGGSCRGAEDDFAAARQGGGNGEHQYGREEGSGSTGDIQSDAADGHRPLDAADAGHSLHPDLPWQLGLVKSSDVVGCLPDGFPYSRFDLSGAGAELFRGDFQHCIAPVDLDGQRP